MKTLHFFETRRPILTFLAEDVNYAPEGTEILLTAQGEITLQDTPAVEELFHGKPSCFLQVKEGEEILLDGRFHVTFLVLEPNQLVVRISVGDAQI